MTEIQTPVPPPSVDDRTEFEALIDQFLAPEGVSEGDIVKGRVLRVGHDHVTVDIGYKSEGRIPIDEFLDRQGELTVKEGDSVDVYVEYVDDEEGEIGLSREKAQKLRFWEQIAECCEKDDVIEGTIVSRVKGGLKVDIGVEAFLPGSQVDIRSSRNLEKYIGETYRFKVIKFNRKRGNVVLSRRVLLEEEREALKRQTLSNLEVGQIVRGVIKNLTDYGAFVDLGGIDGLLHVTDMSWGRVSHPAELFKVGDEVDVKVLKFDPETERVSLGVKQITPDPWLSVEDRYHVDQHIHGRVVSLTDYGAFIEIEPGVEGLVHVSEMSWTKRIKHPSEILKEGDEVEAVILEIDAKNKRIGLGMKQAQENPWSNITDRYPIGSVVRGKVRNVTNFGIFVGIEDGIDGLVHISDLTWSPKVRHPGELYKKGDEVEAMVLHVDPKAQKFSLGIKQLLPDPWERIEQRLPIGSVVEGKVSRILDFGAVVEIDEYLEGFIHISEMSHERIESVGKVLKVGEKVRAKVINLIPEERKIGLSIRRLTDEEARADLSKFTQQQRRRATFGDVMREQLGEQFADLVAAADAKESSDDSATAAESPAEATPAEEKVPEGASTE